MGKRASKPPFSIEVLENQMKERGISCALNSITNDVEFAGVENDSRINPVIVKNSLPAVLYSDLRQTYSGISSTNIIERFLLVLAAQHQYNPVLDYITSAAWDGIDHFNDMITAMGAEVADDELSRILVRKWFHQGVSLLRNSYTRPFGPDGCLTLVGPQGAGKTQFGKWASMAVINSQWFRAGQRLNRYDKDFQRRILTTFVAELGELDSTFNSADNGMIKSFLTQDVDEYRLPFARSDERVPRHVNLLATVNSSAFIVDQTGARRFWTVPVKRFNLDALFNIPAVEVWRQVLVEDDVFNNLQGFRITESERIRLEKRNADHTESLPGEDEILDIIARGNCEFMPILISDWISIYPQLRKFSTRQVAAVCEKLGYTMQRSRINGKQGRYRTLPVPDGYKPVTDCDGL